jgi:hypothetical protein
VFDNLCLAEFVASFERPSRVVEYSNDFDDDDPSPEDSFHGFTGSTFAASDQPQLQASILGFKKRSFAKLIRYINFNKNTDLENWCREQLLLFHPWRSVRGTRHYGDASLHPNPILLSDLENGILLSGCASFEERYLEVQETVKFKSRMFSAQNSVDREKVVEEAIQERTVAETCDDAVIDRVSALGVREDVDFSGELVERRFHSITNVGQYICKTTGQECNDDHVGSYDLGLDFGKQPTGANIELAKVSGDKMVDDPTYRRQVRSLNAEQRLIFDHVLVSLKRNNHEPLHLLLTCGAGVGKSVVTRLIYQAAARWFRIGGSVDPTTRKVLLVAPTGSAAFTIGGQTIHTGLRIPKDQNLNNFKNLTVEKLTEARAADGDVELLIIDKISMVGSRMLNFVNLRLQEQKGNNNPFGGIIHDMT